MDFSKFGLPQWLCVAGGVVLLIAIASYFIAGAKVKIPAIILGVLGGIALGFGGGVLAHAYLGTDLLDPREFDPNDTGFNSPGAGSMPPNMGGGQAQGGRPGGGGGRPGGRGRPEGGGGRPGGGSGFRPTSTNQLSSLIEKLTLLTDQPLALSTEEQKQVQEKLKDLQQLEEVNEDDAKTNLDNLLKVLEPHKDSLVAAGFRWPGERRRNGAPSGRPSPEGNPFNQAETKKNIEALQSRFKKASGG